MNELWLAIEGGGSSTRIVLVDTEGKTIARETAGPSSPLYVNAEDYAKSLRPLLKRIKSATAKGKNKITTLGLAGPMNQKATRQAVQSELGSMQIVETDEGEIALASCGLRVGIAVTSGTGSSCRGVNERGEWATSGGYGPQFGDEGSGYAIAREAIMAAAQAEDGRGRPTRLHACVCNHFNANSVWDVLKEIECNGHAPVPRIASFAPLVFDVARSGDAVAKHIVNDAARALSLMVLAVADQLNIQTSPVPIVLTGGVARAGHVLMMSFKTYLRQGGLSFHLHPTVPDPVMGIYHVIRSQKSKRTR